MTEKARKLAAWNIFVGIVAVGLFIAFIFIACDSEEIAGAYRGRKLIKPFCSSNCVCPENLPFAPVCPQDSTFTYFSPCHAGCQNWTELNNVIVYTDCTCGVDLDIVLQEPTVATEGACGMENCQQYWITFQVLTVVVTMLLASGLIGKVLITIRSVLQQDKSMALAVELTLVGLIVYLPGMASYQAVAAETCQFWSSDQRSCFLHETPTFGNIINIITASMIAVGILFEIAVCYFVKDLPLYGEEPEDAYRPIPMRMVSPARIVDDSSIATSFVVQHPLSADALSDDSAMVRSDTIQMMPDDRLPVQRSFAPMNDNESYTRVVAELTSRQNSSDVDDPMAFLSATSLPRPNIDSDTYTDSEGYDGLPSRPPPLRDYSSSNGPQSAIASPTRTRTRFQNGRPLSPETDF